MLHENNEFSFAMLKYIPCYQEYKAYLGRGKGHPRTGNKGPEG
jgi:hypothetical protein